MSIERGTRLPVLTELAQLIGLPDLGTDEHGCCRLVIDQWPVEIETGGLHAPGPLGTVTVTVVAGLLPVEDREQIAVELLEANFHPSSPQGAAYAVDPASDTVVLRQVLPALTLTGQALSEALQHLVGQVEEGSARWSLEPAAALPSE